MDEAIRPKTATEQAADLARYERLLKAHDWFHEYSDDAMVARQGRAERALLNELRLTLDPDYAIWDQNAPAFFMHAPPQDVPQS